MNRRTAQKEGRTLLHIAVPLTAAYIAEMGMVITDMIIVGRLGSKELAAVGLAGDLFWVFLLIGMGVVSIVGVLAAQSLGEGDAAKTAAAGEQGLIAATLTSLPIMLAVWFMGPVLSHAGQDPDVVRLVTDYSRVLTLAVFPAMWFVALRNFVTALARSAIIGWITLGALLLNLGLNYALVFGVGGLPPLGVVGAGIGTSVVNWIMFATLLRHVTRAPPFEAYRLQLPPRRVDRRVLGELFGLGTPVALTQILNGAMFSAAAVLVGSIGAATLAAQQVIYAVLYIALSAASGFADAVRVRVAYFTGLGDLVTARLSVRLAVTLTALVTAVACLVLWFQPRLLVGAFLDPADTDKQGVLTIAISLSAAAGVFTLLDGVQMILANALRGLRDTRTPLWIALVGYWLVGLGSGVLLCFGLGYGAEGLWWGLAAGVFVCNLLLMLGLRRRWQLTLYLRSAAQ
ncbi:MAG: MATE family efflux transporter [Pseudomonadota bacterium]